MVNNIEFTNEYWHRIYTYTTTDGTIVDVMGLAGGGTGDVKIMNNE